MLKWTNEKGLKLPYNLLVEGSEGFERLRWQFLGLKDALSSINFEILQT